MSPQEIRQLREALQLTQTEFAARLGLKTKGAVSHWESGRKQPTGAALILLRQMAAEAKKARKKEKQG